MAEASTEIERTASLNASAPLATRESEWILFPILLTYSPRANLIMIPAVKTIRVVGV